MSSALPRSWRSFPSGRHAPAPEILRVGDEAWMNVDDLRRLLSYRLKHTVDHGYTNALRWVRLVLTEMLEEEDA